MRDGVDFARAAHAADIRERGADVEARVESRPFVGGFHVHTDAVGEDPDAVAAFGEVLHGVLGDGLETEDLVVDGGAGDHEEVVHGVGGVGVRRFPFVHVCFYAVGGDDGDGFVGGAGVYEAAGCVGWVLESAEGGEEDGGGLLREVR